jgi:hypothetical protein
MSTTGHAKWSLLGERRRSEGINLNADENTTRANYDRVAVEYARRVNDELHHKLLERRLLVEYATRVEGRIARETTSLQRELCDLPQQSPLRRENCPQEQPGTGVKGAVPQLFRSCSAAVAVNVVLVRATVKATGVTEREVVGKRIKEKGATWRGRCCLSASWSV